MPALSPADAARDASDVALPNVLTVWARLLVETLVRGGLRRVVVSPGSRSTPLLLALSRHPELTLECVIDERAAAFVALAQARVTGRASALLCTSGSAPAHYFPALIEASEAGVPLLVLSADRPRELARSGAPQSTEQTALFGVHVREAFDLGEPDGDERALRGMRRQVATAISATRGPRPGPVHLNVRARKPLEPRVAEGDRQRELDALGRARAERAPTIDPPRLAMPDLSGLLDAIASATRPAIVAGALPLAACAWRPLVRRLVQERGLTLLAEPASQLRFDGVELGGRSDAFGEWIGEAPDADPDLVLEIGGTPTSARYARFAAGGRARRFVLDDRPRDPHGTAEALLVGDVDAALCHLLEALPERACDARGRMAADASACARVESVTPPWSEGAVTRALFEAAPAGALIALANSGPIRHAARFVAGRVADVRVASQRGVNGIDGAIASAFGLALADGGPVAALLGDVAFAHDLGSLALAARAESPLVLLVIDNDGGRIFDTLPIAQAGLDEAERALFTTPPRLDLLAIAAAHGIATADVTERGALDAALGRAFAHPGATVLRATVRPEEAGEVASALRKRAP